MPAVRGSILVLYGYCLIIVLYLCCESLQIFVNRLLCVCLNPANPVTIHYLLSIFLLIILLNSSETHCLLLDLLFIKSADMEAITKPNFMGQRATVASSRVTYVGACVCLLAYRPPE